MIHKQKAKSKIFHYNFFPKSRRAAMEMSIGTIVTIALLMVVLVMGMYLIRTIMCSGIILTEEISESVTNEVKGLFGVDDFGVKCMGEGGSQATLGDGGRRQVVCVINEDTQADYELRADIESLKGTPTNIVRDWILDEDWKGTISPGQKTVVVLLLDVPRDVSDTSLSIEIEEWVGGVKKETHKSYVDIKHVGTLNSAIC